MRVGPNRWHPLEIDKWTTAISSFARPAKDIRHLLNILAETVEY